MTRRTSPWAQAVTVVVVTMAALATRARAARAEQFVLVDDTFTFTKADADKSQSHHFVNMVNQPATNWLAPVDYRNGTVHIRTEVLEKAPGGEITQWSICYFGSGNSYGCDESGPYTQAGVVQPEREVSMTSWWQNETIDWTKGIKQMAFVMKDKDESNGHTFKRPDPEHFFPTKVRITMIQVAKGSKYDPVAAGFGPAGVDAGAAADAATPSVDAGGAVDAPKNMPDASIVSGTGGSGAAGGSAGSTSGGTSGGATDTGSNGGASAAGSGGGTSAAGGHAGAGGSSPGSGAAGTGAAPDDGSGGTSQTGHGGSRASGGASSSATGCSMGANGRSGAIALLALTLGLAMIARRRR